MKIADMATVTWKAILKPLGLQIDDLKLKRPETTKSHEYQTNVCTTDANSIEVASTIIRKQVLKVCFLY